LLVFSITSPSTLNELAGLREEIIRIKDDENVPMVIVGNKADLEEGRVVPRAKGFSISQRWGAPYYEASARTRSESMVTRPSTPFRANRAKSQCRRSVY
jgi:GTPase SAR1 family protein